MCIYVIHFSFFLKTQQPTLPTQQSFISPGRNLDWDLDKALSPKAASADFFLGGGIDLDKALLRDY